MAIGSSDAFARLASLSGKVPSKDEQKKAQVWANIGYIAEGAGAEGEDVFVSLPFGLAIDTMTPMARRGKQEWLNRVDASNNLLEQLIEAGMSLQPGEHRFLNTEGPLVIQLLRVGEAAEPSKDNPLLKKLI